MTDLDQPVALAATARTAPARRASGPSLGRALRPLAVDLAVPLAAYFVAEDVIGTSMITAMIVSSIVPLIRTVVSVLVDRKLNLLASMVLAVDVAGIAVSLASGDVRLLFARNSVVSSVIALGILWSVLRRRPVMSAGLRPFVTKGDPAADAAWDRLATGSARFRFLENRYSLVWGVSFLLDCLIRLACAFLAPVSVLGWLSTPVVIAAIVAGGIVGGGLTVEPMQTLIAAEIATETTADVAGSRR